MIRARVYDNISYYREFEDEPSTMAKLSNNPPLRADIPRDIAQFTTYMHEPQASAYME